MRKINKKTLARNAAAAKAALIRQEEKLKKLTTQLIDVVGTGGETIETSLGQVVVSAQTFDRASGITYIQFDQAVYDNLKPQEQAYLISLGVVKGVPGQIKGQAPRVSFRLNKE